MRAIASSVVAALAAFASSQAVTEKQFYAVFGQFEAAQLKILNLPAPAQRDPGSDKPVTRAAVVAAFDRTWTAVKPKVRITPRKYRFDLALLESRNDANVASQLAKLAEFGLVMPTGPLAVGPKETMDSAQLGDEIGYFFAQVSCLTHKPSAKWTPSLMPVEGDG